MAELDATSPDALQAAADARFAAGDLAGGAELLDRAIAAGDARHGPSSPEATRLRVVRANLWMTDGRLAQARELYEVAIAAYSTMNGLFLENADARVGLALLLGAQGADEEALTQYATALELCRSVVRGEEGRALDVSDLVAEGAALTPGGRELAISAATHGMELRIRRHGRESLEAAEGLTLMASVLNLLEAHDLAREAARQAIGIYRKRGGPEHAGFKEALEEELYARMAMIDTLDPADREALETELIAALRATQEEADPGASPARSELAVLLEALDQMERGTIEGLHDGDAFTWNQFRAHNARNTSAPVSLHLHRMPEDPLFQERAVTAVLRRKTRELDARIEASEAMHGQRGPGGQTIAEELADVRAQRAERAIAGGEAAALEGLAVRERALEAEAAMRAARGASSAERVTSRAVVEALPTGTALLEFVTYLRYYPERAPAAAYGGARYAVYVLRPDRKLAWADLGEVAPIDAAVTALRTAMADPMRRDAVPQLAAELFARTLAPVEAHLAGASHWIVAPDGQLALAPFHALRGSDGRYVLEHVAVSYLPTGRHLLRPRDVGGESGPPVIVAAPDFERASDGATIASTGSARTRSADLRWAHFGALPETATEARELSERLPRAELLLGSDADESHVKALVRPRILHIATHGYFLSSEADRDGTSADASDDPLLRSGLVLAGANNLDHAVRGTRDDGVLTALEASSLDLTGTELVVLSACETGLGAASAGAGVFGLQRAFAMAGARSQVLSLWRVDDVATRRLMVDFYDRLAEGASRAEALRQSQLALLHEPATAHPFYWGAFQLYGDWQSLAPSVSPDP